MKSSENESKYKYHQGGGVVNGLIPINEFSSFQHISAGSENQDAGKQNVRHSNCKIPLFWDALHMVYVDLLSIMNIFLGIKGYG